RVDERAHLARGAAIPGGCAEQICVGPNHVIETDFRNVARTLGHGLPRGLAVHDVIRSGFAGFAEPDICAGGAGGLGGGLGHLVVMAVGRLVPVREFHSAHTLSCRSSPPGFFYCPPILLDSFALRRRTRARWQPCRRPRAGALRRPPTRYAA